MSGLPVSGSRQEFGANVDWGGQQDLHRPSVLAVPPQFTFQSLTTLLIPSPYPSVWARSTRC